MDYLRDNIARVMREYGKGCSVGETSPSDCVDCTEAAIDELMRIINRHIEWTDAKDCQYGYTYSNCGWYEICDEFTLQTENGYYIGQFSTLDEAKEAAQKHKDIYGG